MNESGAVEALAHELEHEARTTRRFAEALFRLLGVAAWRGEFSWPGFGKFYVRKWLPRTVPHPITGRPMKAPVRLRIALRCSGSGLNARGKGEPMT